MNWDQSIPEQPFTFTNQTGRPPGVVTRALARALPGVAEVQAQVEPHAAAWRAANQRALKQPGRRWIVFGDSMSQAVGVEDPRRGWVTQLQHRLTVELNVINLSQTGARVSDVLEQQLPAWRTLPPAPDDLVTVLIGSNDVMSPLHRGGLADAFDELLGQLPRGAIVATLPTPHRAARAVNAAIADDAGRGRIQAVATDALGAGAWRGKLSPDRFHPNEAGYAMIADAFEPHVRRALGSATWARKPTV